MERKKFIMILKQTPEMPEKAVRLSIGSQASSPIREANSKIYTLLCSIVE